MSPEKKPEKQKPERSTSEAEAEILRPGLERRLRAAKSEKSGIDSKSVSCKDLIDAAKTTNNKFTLASIELFEFAHIAKSKSSEQAEKLAQVIEREISTQLRHEDRVAYAGSGKYFIYLPETAKTESTMVLERLSRQICKRSQKRPVAPQVSLSFKVIPLDTITQCTETSKPAQSKEPVQGLTRDQRNTHFENWLGRYKLIQQTDAAEWKEHDVWQELWQDLWTDCRTVCIRRFNLSGSLESDTRKQLANNLSSIQISGLALLPHLLDFHIGEDFVCLSFLPHPEEKQPLNSSVKTAHNLLIAVCDSFLQLNSMTPPLVPPELTEDNFFSGSTENEFVYRSFDEYIISALTASTSPAEKTSQTQDIRSFSELAKAISKSFATDECFSTAIELLTDSSKNKNPLGSIQKLRAILKRHEERLRRTQTSKIEGKP